MPHSLNSARLCGPIPLFTLLFSFCAVHPWLRSPESCENPQSRSLRYWKGSSSRRVLYTAWTVKFRTVATAVSWCHGVMDSVATLWTSARRGGFHSHSNLDGPVYPLAAKALIIVLLLEHCDSLAAVEGRLVFDLFR